MILEPILEISCKTDSDLDALEELETLSLLIARGRQHLAISWLQRQIPRQIRGFLWMITSNSDACEAEAECC
jgi:hypothetical protein